MAAKNLKRKRTNSRLTDPKKTRPSKVSTIIRPISIKQMDKRTEDVLWEIEERFRLAFENANIGMCLVDLQGRLTKVNHQMCKIFGYSHEELERMTVNDLVHPEDLDISPTFIKRATSGEIEHTTFEKRYFHKDGHILFGQVSSSLVRDTEGKPQYFISHVQDITERKRAEENLKESEEKYRLLVERLAQGIVIGQGIPPRVVFANSAMTKILGYNLEEFSSLSPKEIESLVHPEDRAVFFNNYKNRLEGKSPAPSYEIRGIRKDGMLVWLELSSARIEYRGQPAVQAAFLDITERKRAEETLRQSEEKYRTILENIEDGYYEVDIAGNITFCNDSFCRLFGYSKDEMMGMNDRQYTDEENANKLYQAFNKVYRTREPTKAFDLAVFRKDGTKLFGEVSVSLMTDATGQPIGFRGIARDITERKRAEEFLCSERDKFRGMLLAIHDGVDIVNRDYIIEFQNKLLRERFGDKTGEKCYVTYMGLEEPCHFCSIQEAIKTGRASRVELVGKDGRNYELNSSPFTDVDGKVKAIELVRDITEHKHAERALRESEEKYRAILENIEDAYYEVDLTGNLTFFNDSLCRLVGYSREELMGMSNRQLTDPRSAQKLYREFNKVYRTGRSSNVFDWEIIKKDGKKRNVEASVSLIKDPRRHPIGFRGIIRDITERKQAEEALRESEERYRTILENIEDGYYEVDLRGDFTFFNDSLRRMLGYSKEEMLGMGNQQYTDEENRKKLFQAFNEVYRTGKSTKGFGWEVIRKDGSKLFSEVSVSLIKDSTEQPIGFRGIARDITERKRAEEVLRKSEEEFRLTFENAKDAIIWADPEAGIMIRCNRQAETLLEKKGEEIIGSHQTTLHPPQKAEYYTNMFKKHLEYKGVTDDEAEVITKSGKIKPVSITASLTLVGGKPIIQGIFRDITERKQAEEALRNEKQRFQTLSEQAPFGMVMIDQDGTFRYMNPKFKELFGYDLTDVPNGKTWFRKAYPDSTYRHHVIETWIKDLEIFQPKEKRSEVFTVTCKDGTIKIINFIPVQLDTGENLMACEDISDLKRAEEEKAVLEEQLRQSQKMEAVGRLAGGIAHDFNNLLTIIKGYSQLSLLELKEGDILKGNIEEIQKAAERAATLTAQLLAFSRRQVMQMKVFNFNTALRDLDNMLRRVIGEDIELVTILADDLGKTKADPGQIEQVIMNLAVNARDAMPSGGKLIIETANVEFDENYPRVHAAMTPGRYVMLSVSDTGFGMTPEVRERLFEPFFTTKEKGKGTGLGLSTVYGIVKQSGGYIWVYSEPGQGTTVKIYFPRVDEEDDALFRRDGVSSIPQGSETVLVVEDEPSLRSLATHILRHQGYKVLEAADGEEALRVAQECIGEINLLLTDVVMPRMGGKELADRLQTLRPSVRVLFISGFPDDAIAHHGVITPGIAFLQKPFSPASLAQKVREVLDGEVK